MNRMILFILIRSTQVRLIISNLIIALVAIILLIRDTLEGRACLKGNQSRGISLINRENLINGQSPMPEIYR
ncbi:MAG: hypothetical protein WCI28_08170 [Opitutaceae bacterium]|jgi:hypothetical protein